MIQRLSRFFLYALPYGWLLMFLLVPFIIVLRIALSDSVYGLPPFAPLIDLSKGWQGLMDTASKWDLENFWWLWQDSLYYKSFRTSLTIASISTFLTLLVAYPMALGMTRAPKSWRNTLVMLVILPFWTSFLIRVYAWVGILKKEGLLNLLLTSSGLVQEPLEILNTSTAVYIGIVYSYLPFMVLPLYATLERMDNSLLEAAQDLGCSRIRAFWTVTFPLSMPGVIAGCLLVFIPAMGEYVIPELLGGSDEIMIGKTLYDEFFRNRDWPLASMIAIILLVLLIVPIVWFQRGQAKEISR